MDDIELKEEVKNHHQNSIFYDEAIEKTGNGKFQLLVLLLFALSTISVFVEGLNMAYVLPAAKCDLEITVAEQGLINAANYIGVVISSIFWGFVADGWGRKNVLQLCYFLTFIFAVLSSFSISAVMLFTTRLLVGVCLSSFQPCCITYLGEFHCDKNRFKYVSLSTTFSAFALGLQPVLGWLFMTMEFEYEFFDGFFIFKPWRLYLLLTSLITAASFTLIQFLPESPKFLLTVNRQKEALAILNKIHLFNEGKGKTYEVNQVCLMENSSTNFSQVHGVKEVLLYIGSQIKPIFMPPYLKTTLLLSLHAFALYAIGLGISLWLPQMVAIYDENSSSSYKTCEVMTMAFEKINNATVNTTSESSSCLFTINSFAFQVTVALGFFYTFANLIITFIIRRFGKMIPTMTWLFCGASLIYVLNFSTYFYLNILVIGIMVSGGSTSTVTMAFAADLFPTQYKNKALSIVFTMGLIGAVAGSNMLAVLLPKYCSVMFNTFGVIFFGAVLTAYLILRQL